MPGISSTVQGSQVTGQKGRPEVTWRWGRTKWTYKYNCNPWRQSTVPWGLGGMHTYPSLSPTLRTSGALPKSDSCTLPWGQEPLKQAICYCCRSHEPAGGASETGGSPAFNSTGNLRAQPMRAVHLHKFFSSELLLKASQKGIWAKVIAMYLR